jgi:protein-tyrosine phosphatase
MIDIHCHVLPAVDDGARDLQEAIALVRLAESDGIREMVLTPHIYAGRFDNSLEELEPLFAAFVELVRSNQIDVVLHLGAEVRLLPESLALIEAGGVPFVGSWAGEQALLLEFHDGRIPPFAANAVRHLRRRGLRPIIAHPERNRAVMADADCLTPLLDAGCLLQVTAGSMIGAFGARAQQSAFELLDRRWVHFVASDAHNQLYRPPLMKRARAVLAARHGEELAEALTASNPRRLVHGEAPAR